MNGMVLETIHNTTVLTMEVVPAGVGDMDVDVGYIGGGYIDGGYVDGGYVDGGYDDGSMTGETAKAPLSDRLLGSVVFIGGTGVLSLAFGIVCGILLAKRKIKKGIDLYED